MYTMSRISDLALALLLADDVSLEAAAIQENATLVLNCIDVPPFETKVIERAESGQVLQNSEELRTLVESVTFYVNGITENVPFHVEFSESVAVIISFTAELKKGKINKRNHKKIKILRIQSSRSFFLRPIFLCVLSTMFCLKIR